MILDERPDTATGEVVEPQVYGCYDVTAGTLEDVGDGFGNGSRLRRHTLECKVDVRLKVEFRLDLSKFQ